MGDSKKTKLPKRIAGIKLPKKVRRKANKALGALDQPLVRELASAAIAAASSAAASRATRRPAEEPAPAEKPGKEAAAPPSASGEIGQIAAGLALAAISKWLAGKPPAAESDEGAAEPEPPA